MKRPNIEEFSTVCRAKGGVISGIASSFGVERLTVYRWCKIEKYQQAIDDARDTFLDMAETNLQTLVKGIPKIKKLDDGRLIQEGWEVEPSESAIVFTLKTLGRKRGYSERKEVDANVNIPPFQLDDGIAE